MFESMIDSDLI